MTTLPERRAKLQARLQDLNTRMDTIANALEAHKSADWGEMAIEREEDEVLQDMGNSSKLERRMIQAALARMDQGDYGYCVDCGSEIAQDRLTILPATPFCATCAAKHA